MRSPSAARWRDVLLAYDRYHVCTADPGSHAVMTEIAPLLRDMDRLAGWYVEGWAAVRAPELPPATALFDVAKPGDTVMLGARTDFARTQGMLVQARAHGCSTIFVFDHWKNYSENFGVGPLADLIIVPDDAAYSGALAALGAAAQPHLRVLPHPAIEAAIDRIRSFGDIEIARMVALLLDPTEEADGLGYNWRSTLAAAASIAMAKPELRILIKPHPRQQANVVSGELESWMARGIPHELFSGDTDRLIAMSEEVWGMTTIALNVALAAGKPIRSFQIGRNDAGRSASNPHIEPHVVLNADDLKKTGALDRG